MPDEFCDCDGRLELDRNPAARSDDRHERRQGRNQINPSWVLTPAHEIEVPGVLSVDVGVEAHSCLLSA
jgi:hypothetical protein